MRFEEMQNKNLRAYDSGGNEIQFLRAAESVNGGIIVTVLAMVSVGDGPFKNQAALGTDDAVECKGFVKGCYIK